MVELQLDTIDWEQHSREYFLSVRVGETQKFSKISPSRNYKFCPKAVGGRRYGKIDIFRRVGGASICIDPATVHGENTLSIECENSEVSFNMKLSGSDGNGKPIQNEETPPEKPTNPKVAQAKEYMAFHQLEARLSEAMQQVLREKPEDPIAFVAKRLQNNAHLIQKAKITPKSNEETRPNTADDQAIQKSAPPQESTPAPPKESVPTQPETSPAKAATQQDLPFGEYYRKHFNVSKSASADLVTALANLHAKFPVVKPIKPLAAAEPLPPSEVQKTANSGVGFTKYYVDHMLPRDLQPFQKLHAAFPAKSSAKPETSGDAPPAAAPVAVPAKQQSSIADAGFTKYYLDHILPRDLQPFEKLYAAFPAKMPTKPKTSGDAALPAAPVAVPAKPQSSSTDAGFTKYYLDHMLPRDLQPFEKLYAAFPSKTPAKTNTSGVHDSAAAATAAASAVAAAAATAAARVESQAPMPLFSTYYKEHVLRSEALRPCFDSLYTKFPARAAAPSGSDAKKVAADTSNANATDGPKEHFAVLPSVGAWLLSVKQDQDSLQDDNDAATQDLVTTNSAPSDAPQAPSQENTTKRSHVMLTSSLYGPLLYQVGMAPSIWTF